MSLPAEIKELISEYAGAFRVFDKELTLTFKVDIQSGTGSFGRETNYRTLQVKVLSGLWFCSMSPCFSLLNQSRNALILYHSDFPLHELPSMSLDFWLKEGYDITENICLYSKSKKEGISINLPDDTECNITQIHRDELGRFIIIPVAIYDNKASYFVDRLYEYAYGNINRLITAEHKSDHLEADNDGNGTLKFTTHNLSHFFPTLTEFFQSDEIEMYIIKDKISIIGEGSEVDVDVAKGTLLLRAIYPYMKMVTEIFGNNMENKHNLRWIFHLQQRIMKDAPIRDYKIISETQYKVL